MIKFSKEKILLLHQIIAEATGGSVGVRERGPVGIRSGNGVCQL